MKKSILFLLCVTGFGAQTTSAMKGLSGFFNNHGGKVLTGVFGALSMAYCAAGDNMMPKQVVDNLFHDHPWPSQGVLLGLSLTATLYFNNKMHVVSSMLSAINKNKVFTIAAIGSLLFSRGAVVGFKKMLSNSRSEENEERGSSQSGVEVQCQYNGDPNRVTNTPRW